MKDKKTDEIRKEYEKVCDKIEQLNERAFEIEKEMRWLKQNETRL